jgi:hypothetical protein
VTKHHARQFGVSKYGIGRTFRVLLDLVTVKYLTSYMTSPMKLFGKFGLWSFSFAILTCLLTIGMKVISGVDMTGNPLLLLTVFAGFVGMQFLVLGMLGELGVRTYYESQGKTYYTVRTRLNMEAEPVMANNDEVRHALAVLAKYTTAAPLKLHDTRRAA